MSRSTLGLVAASSIAVLTTFALRGDADPDANRRMRQSFESNLQQSRSELASACGFNKVTVDWDRFDAERWIEVSLAEQGTRKDDENYASRRKQVIETPRVEGTCYATIRALVRLCQNPKWKPMIQAQVKELRCLFDGFQPQRNDDGEGQKPFYRRNYSFANSAVTVRNSPYIAGSMEEFVVSELPKSFQAAERGAQLSSGNENGDTCTRWQQCESGVCKNGVCTMCSAKVACQKPNSSCDRGSCFTDAEVKSQSEYVDKWRGSKPATPAPKPKGSKRGAMCGKPSDCASGSCKMLNKTRGQCM